jgi:nitrogenase molybdenum-iron protein NifN
MVPKECRHGCLEDLAAGCDLLVTHSHGRQAAERLDIPLMRVGFSLFRRGGANRLNDWIDN